MLNSTASEKVDTRVAIDERGQHHVIQIIESVKYTTLAGGRVVRQVLSTSYSLMNGSLLSVDADGEPRLPNGLRLNVERKE